MIKVHYTDIKKLKEEYLKIFDIDTMKSKWAHNPLHTDFSLEDLLYLLIYAILQ